MVDAKSAAEVNIYNASVTCRRLIDIPKLCTLAVVRHAYTDHQEMLLKCMHQRLMDPCNIHQCNFHYVCHGALEPPSQHLRSSKDYNLSAPPFTMAIENWMVHTEL